MVEDTFLADVFNRVKIILNSVPRSEWASAMTGLILAMGDRVGARDVLFRIAQDALHANLSKVGNGSDFDLTRTFFSVTHKDVLTLDGSNPFYLPYRLLDNNIFPFPDSQAMRRFLGWENDEDITSLVQSMVAYCRSEPHAAMPLSVTESEQNVITVAMSPYHDCIGVAMVFFLVRDLLPGGVGLRFEVLNHWSETKRAADQGAIDIGFGMRKEYAEEIYEFEPIRYTTDQFGYLSCGKPTDHRAVRILNFQSPTPTDQGGGSSIAYLPKECGGNSVVSEPVKQTELDEAAVILAMANGLVKRYVIVPSLQGFLWAAEAGLLKFEIESKEPSSAPGNWRSGALFCSDAVITGVNKQQFGYFIWKRETSVVAHNLKRAIDALHSRFQRKVRQALDAEKRGRAELSLQNVSGQESEQEIERMASRVREYYRLLLTPVSLKDPSYFGMINRIPPSLALRAAYGDLHQQEFHYRPGWWASIRRSLEKEAIGSIKKEIGKVECDA